MVAGRLSDAPRAPVVHASAKPGADVIYFDGEPLAPMAAKFLYQGVDGAVLSLAKGDVLRGVRFSVTPAKGCWSNREADGS